MQPQQIAIQTMEVVTAKTFWFVIPLLFSTEYF